MALSRVWSLCGYAFSPRTGREPRCWVPLRRCDSSDFLSDTPPQAPQDVDCFFDVRLLDFFGFSNRFYEESPDVSERANLQITRASHVEPDAEGFWWAGMGPVDGPVLGPFSSRTEALGAERRWLVRQA